MASPLLLQPSSTLGSRQFRTNQEKLDRVSSLSDRKRQRVRSTVGQAKRGYHSEESSEEFSADTYDDHDGGIVAGPSTLPESEAENPVQSDNSPGRGHKTQVQHASLPSLEVSRVVGSGLAAGAVTVMTRRTRKSVDRVNAANQVTLRN